jgi:DNA-binding NtrC family response regulator
VLGGTDEQRLAVARAFHEASPLRGGPFVAVDCARDELRLLRALQSWLMPEDAQPGANPLRESEGGTLFLDSVACLSASTQRQLLALARRLQQDPADLQGEPGPFRLEVGNAEDLAEAVAQRSFSAALYDCLDKIRVDLNQVRGRGVA